MCVSRYPEWRMTLLNSQFVLRHASGKNSIALVQTGLCNYVNCCLVLTITDRPNHFYIKLAKYYQIICKPCQV
jgi:hypothetical protein